MLVEDIYPSLKRAVGNCSETEIFRLLNLAVEMLANKKLVDPLLATLDFYADGGFFFALPRDVKTPIKVNINNNPAFARSRIFEFSQNTDGTVDGAEINWSWHDRGYLPIQDERKLPGRLKYVTTDEADNGKTVKVFGRSTEGREISVTLTGNDEDPQLSEETFVSVDRVVRQLTGFETFLQTETEENVARYYPDERVPEYRVIKLSQKAVACRLLYRKHVWKLASMEDVIPMRSQLALIQAVKGVVLLEAEDPAAEMYFAKAAEFLADEQNTREENTTATDGLEAQTATNTNISTRDCVIAADVYDTACEIFGPIGRAKILDRMTDAVEALAAKGEWDALKGAVDLWTRERANVTNPKGKGDGYFVLPRRVESVLAINFDGEPVMPRNRWSEYHVNGSGERYKAPAGNWDEAGEVVLLNELPLDPDTKRVIPHKLFAVPENAVDNDTEITAYGVERLENGEERVVWRDGKLGFLVPCEADAHNPGTRAPNWVRIDRVKKAASVGFIKLYALREDFLSMAAVGDMGYPTVTTPETDAVELLIKGSGVSDVALLGDINYPSGQAGTIDANVGARWRKFIFPYLGNKLVTELKEGETDATENHLWPVPGNHDWDNGGEDDLQPYLDYFELPNNERYYTYTLGPVQFFVLDSSNKEPDGNSVGSKQHQWLVAEVAKSTARWKVALFHHSPYTSGTTHGSFLVMRWNFRELGINLVLTGHNHNYERLEADGVTYAVVGTGSPSLYGFEETPSSFSKKRLQVNGALFLSILDGKLWTTFKGVDGTILDTADIEPTAAPPEELLVGYYEPDETEPSYRLIKVPSCKSERIRVLYRKRALAIRSLHEPLHLKSRLAIINAMRAIKAEETDPAASVMYMETAKTYLKDQEWSLNPTKSFSLQINGGTWPGGFENIT